MPVRDIELRQGVDRAGQRRDGVRVVDDPELVADAVVGGDVDVRAARRGAPQQGDDLRGGRIGDHHRPGLGIDRLDLAHAVVFLDGGRELVLADAVAGVIGDRGGRGEPGLPAVAPGQPVDIVAGRRVAGQHAGRDHAGEIVGGLGVDGAIVRVDARVEVDLGL